MLQAVLILQKKQEQTLKMQQEMELILSKVSTFKFLMINFILI
jgi:hypothetical protein